VNRRAGAISKRAQKAGEGVRASHIKPTADRAVEDAQLVADFHQLDDYGRRVALAMMCSLVRLAAARSGVAAS
jgi:hypothetical protein